WKLRSLPAHMRRGSGMGGMNPPSSTCPSAPSSLIGTSSSEKCSQCPRGKSGAVSSPSRPSSESRRATRSPEATSSTVEDRPTQSCKFRVSSLLMFSSLPLIQHSDRRHRKSDLVPADELFGDDTHLDLVRTLPHDHQRSVTVVAFDVIFGGISVTAMHADRVEGHLGGHLRSIELRHSGLHIHTRPRIISPRRMQNQLPGGLELRRHHRQLVA